MNDGSDATLFRYIGNGWTDPVNKNFFMTKLQFSNTQGKEIEVCKKIAIFLNVPFVMQFTNAVSKIENSLSNT